MGEPRPTAAQRGYDATWRKRREAQLERQPWCELCAEADGLSPDMLSALAANRMQRRGLYLMVTKEGERLLSLTAATTVDHRRARRTYPLHLQRSDQPGGADHPTNLRSLCASHHCRRADDKARRRA